MTTLLQAARYSAVNAQVCALQARLLPASEWAALLDAPDLPSLLALLRTTWYGAVLPYAGSGEPSAQQVERALVAVQAQVARLPCAMLQGGPRALLEWFWRRFEVTNVKTILRAVHHQAPPSQVQAALIPLGSRAMAPWPDLVTASSIPALVEALVGVWYGRVLRHALDQAARQQSIFPLEVALDLAYYGELLAHIDRLHGTDHADAALFLGEWVDSQNLLWAYRFHLNAQLSPEEILNYTLHRRLRVNAEVVRSIALGAPLLDTVARLWPQRLPAMAELVGLTAAEALPRLELIFQRHFYALAQRTRAALPLRLAPILAFEFLLEYEVRDLTAVLEGKNAGWPGERIRPYLIGVRG